MERKSYYNLEHQKKYREKNKSVTVSFNLEKEDESEIYKHLNSVEKKATYIKSLIAKDLQK